MAEAGKYGIVYADPPWRYDMKRGNGVAEIWEITNWWIPAHWRFGRPRVARRHTSALERVQNPIP